MILTYGDIIISDDETKTDGVSVLRIVKPANADTETTYQRRGFFLADRTVKTTISLAKCETDLDKFIRLPIVETTQYKEDILKIAVESFVYDRRFHVLPDCSTDISGMVLKQWVEELDTVFVALFKELPIGFLALKETSADTLFVHLAAVSEKYRMTGAAMALYANACKVAKQRGYKRLEGRISTQNTAVMNVYAAFGAVFSEPQDIFIKEVSHDVE
ncbi:MAG: GNAT family N-acetyltransferase [Alphaproteobacteria bacterium]|nr:GNAT family N-acetyltransferase [Alphaproteobacteria bacterium]